MSNNKTVLVTGSNKGIGFEIAQGLLNKGYRVIITSRSVEKGEQALAKLQEFGEVMMVELDVSDDRSIQQAFTTVQSKIDRLDVLVNNAGIYPDDGVDILTISRELLESTFHTNTFGAIKTAQTFLPLLQKSDDARIVNFSSSYGQIDGLSSNVPSYCLSKLALNGATIMLADSLKSQGIAVNSICPGWVQTDMGGSSAPRTPEQGADTAIWLATEASCQLTGNFWRDKQEIDY